LLETLTASPHTTRRAGSPKLRKSIPPSGSDVRTGAEPGGFTLRHADSWNSSDDRAVNRADRGILGVVWGIYIRFGVVSGSWV